jgi:predicted ATPase/DNA-binding XRE family transcriptional regulator
MLGGQSDQQAGLPMDTRAEQSFAELLRRARREAGLTQEELAARAGISTRAVSDLEREINRTPQLETLRLLADALELSSPDRQTWSAVRRRTSTRERAHVRHEATGTQQGGHLPTPLTSFVGRDREVAEVVAMLGRPNVRLVTITGPGGVGKTRLAIAAGQRVTGSDGRFPDGVWFVNLAPLRDPELVLPSIATALSLSVSGKKPVLMALIGTLRNTSRLLVLDNVEQVVMGVPRLADLLIACPGLVVLATSRIPLRIQGEHEYAVKPFVVPAPATVGDLDGLRRYPAIDLFQQRAQDIVADFQITDGNAQAVVGICQRVDGLPLAIELVAARVRLLPPGALLARLERRLPLLSGATHDVPERQQTLRNTIAWSYGLLEATHHRLFRALGVFQGGWTLDAAEAVVGHTCDGTDVLDGLETLVAHNLVRMHEQLDGEPRYSMLETIAEFAREQLDERDEARAVYQRHVQHFLHVATRAEPHLKGVDQTPWMAMLEQEHANLRGALQWLDRQSEQGDVDAVLTSVRLVSTIFWFWYVQGHMREARQHFATILAHLRDRQAAIQSLTGPTEWSSMNARLLFLLSGFSTWQADHHDEQAWLMLLESLNIYRNLNQTVDIASTLMYLGYGAQRVGKFAEAEAFLIEGLAISRELNDDGLVALLLQGLGMIGLRRGDYDGGSAWVTESLAVFTSLGDERGIAAASATLGALRLRQQDLVQANALLSNSLALRHRIGDKGGIAWCLEWMAEAALAEGRPPDSPLRAARLLGAATALRVAIDSPIDPVDVPDHKRIVAAIQSQLTDPAFVAAWEGGRMMTLDDVTSYTLDRNSTDSG